MFSYLLLSYWKYEGLNDYFDRRHSFPRENQGIMLSGRFFLRTSNLIIEKVEPSLNFQAFLISPL